jgi:hypothetical protein
MLDAPGYGSQQILENPQGSHWSGGPNGTVKYVTTENWRITCIAASNGGEGFLAVAPNGDQYRFDLFVSRPYHYLGTQGGTSFLARHRNMLVATQVTDVNGNWVQYHYDANGRLDYIDSNDGRYIDLTYNAGATGYADLIYQVKANQAGAGQRTWTYAYAPSNYAVNSEIDPDNPRQVAVLRTVTLPNSTAWQFALDGMAAPPGPGLKCPNGIGGAMTVTHPNGALGSFVLSEKKHRQSLNNLMQVSNGCPFTDLAAPQGPTLPVYGSARAEVMGVSSKTVAAPNAPTATWTYSYENDDGTGPTCAAGEPCRTNWTKVQEPNGRHATWSA